MGTEPDYDALARILRRHKNLLLEGVPGTGKTYAIQKVIDAIRAGGQGVGGDGTGDFAVTMHPSTSYEDFVEGLKPQSKGINTFCKPVNTQITHKITFTLAGENCILRYGMKSDGTLSNVSVENCLTDLALVGNALEWVRLTSNGVDREEILADPNRQLQIPRCARPQALVEDAAGNWYPSDKGRISHYIFNDDDEIEFPRRAEMTDFDQNMISMPEGMRRFRPNNGGTIQINATRGNTYERFPATPHPNGDEPEEVRIALMMNFRKRDNGPTSARWKTEQEALNAVNSIRQAFDEGTIESINALPVNADGNAELEVMKWYQSNRLNFYRLVPVYRASKFVFSLTNPTAVGVLLTGEDCCEQQALIDENTGYTFNFIDVGFQHLDPDQCSETVVSQPPLAEKFRDVLSELGTSPQDCVPEDTPVHSQPEAVTNDQEPAGETTGDAETEEDGGANS